MGNYGWISNVYFSDKHSLSCGGERKLLSTPITAEDGSEIIAHCRGRLYVLPRDSAAIFHSTAISNYRRDYGSIIVKLRKVVYRTVQAARLWYNRLSTVLRGGGFKENAYVACVFYRRVGPSIIIVTTHVDELLLISSDVEGVHHVERILRSAFTNININRDSVDYLGIKISKTGKGIQVSLSGFIDDCKHDKIATDVRPYSAPAKHDLFSPGDSEPLDEVRATKFHLMTAKLMFAANRVRPAILTAVTYLSSKVSGPAMCDWNALLHLLGYFKKTKDHKLEC
jgi:hypothetical protein